MTIRHDGVAAREEAALPGTPTFGELVRVAARIGCLSFGGPAGQIALMHRELVDERGWIDEAQFLHALNVCHLLPGPEAQQLAIWIGWKLHGVRGGLAAGLLFVIPGALVILALSMVYGFAARVPWFAALFLGIKSAVLAIVVQALWRVAARALDTGLKRGIAFTAFLALALGNAPFPVVVAMAALLGAIVAAWRPALLAIKPASPPMAHTPMPWRASVTAAAVGAAAWAAPMLLILATLGRGHVLWQIGAFFSRLAVVTFGGAYAVLAYMAQQAVTGHGWLSAGEMADGLGLAETTPGPLIMVTQFVGYLAAFRAPAPFGPVMAGILGALLTTWVTFVPCFLWIFAVAPWLERLEHARRLKGALAAITAAIVGVIANLALWFGLHVLFSRGTAARLGTVSVALPDLASLDWRAAALGTLAAYLLFRRRWSVMTVLLACAAGGLALGMLP
ncbi:chromate efflux transporter [Novosphingobium sp. SG720]|uniref:chromate efflux transporter n=1 Tax=Novosphingobium sp. SG720 TaxID=2586998 RepID=UPI0014487497|nr:chromate efflux transporter [Novosphingobium sp. SG720]NKJ42122.1 chromate transporter [Novosphingobium sp. SG720]